MALGLGATVEVIDINIPRLRQIDETFAGAIGTKVSNKYEITKALAGADLVIGSVLIPGKKAPKLVTDEMVAGMKPGSVLVDIAIDQGGCFENSRPTTHDDPTFTVHNSVYYCVANMPGAVPNTATAALTNSTLPFAVKIADQGWHKALSKRFGTGARTQHPQRPRHQRQRRRGIRSRGRVRGPRARQLSPTAVTADAEGRRSHPGVPAFGSRLQNNPGA
jgi:alanine dehydrogenase